MCAADGLEPMGVLAGAGQSRRRPSDGRAMVLSGREVNRAFPPERRCLAQLISSSKVCLAPGVSGGPNP
eukprot:scaffold22045_cov111-Isochrysis_galbana.AAC.5